MKKLAYLFALVLLLAGLAMLASRGAHAQSGTLGLAGCDQGGRFVACGPVALGANAITLPASGTTANTNIIDLRGVKELKLWAACTQTNSLSTTFYAEDGVTSTGSYVAATGGVASVYGAYALGSESGAGSVQYTPTGGSANHLPERAISFSWTNTTATPGTCTARLFLAY